MFWMWAGFIALVLLLLAADLYVFHRRARVVVMREAFSWAAVWVALALAFTVFIYFAYEHHWLGLGAGPIPFHPEGLNGYHAAVIYVTGYVIELSLSVDNLFVMALVFTYFAIPARYQHRVLFWGILGAQLMRGGMIALGTQLIERFSWILYGFGALLIVMAGRMLLLHDEEADPKRNWAVRLACRFLPVTHELHGQRFLWREPNPAAEGAEGRLGRRIRRWVFTPLAMALVVIELMDLLFAVDSIPAVFAVTTDPFLVFTSNIFAILGLRALYFVLARVLDRFRYLNVSLAILLALVGAKLLLGPWLHEIEHINLYLLGLVVLVLGGGIAASVAHARRALTVAAPGRPANAMR